jgi:hypothetical protein
MKWFDKLCPPAQFYLFISVLSYSFILLQNIGNSGRFTLGTYSCHHSSPGLFLLGQALYIALWTWLLNMICKVNTGISWLIVLFPFILFFILLGLVLVQGVREGADMTHMTL